jgi:hypothetical protein
MSFGTTGTPRALRSPPVAARLWLPGNPAVCYIVHAIPEFIWGMSAKKAERFAPENLATAKDDDRGSPRISCGQGSVWGQFSDDDEKNALLRKEGDS